MTYNMDFNEKVQNLTVKLTCLICKDIYKDASTVSECGHTFCDKCIRGHIPDYNTCYDCGSFAIPINIKSNPPIRNLVELLHELRALGSTEFDNTFSNISNFNLKLPEGEVSNIRLNTINEDAYMEFTQLENIPVKCPIIMDEAISLSQVGSSNNILSKKHSLNSQNFDFTSTQDPAQKNSYESTNYSADFIDGATQLSNNAKFPSEMDEIMEFSPIKTQKTTSGSPIRMILSQVGPSNEPLGKKCPSNSQTTSFTSTQKQLHKPSLQVQKNNRMYFSDDDFLNDALLTSTQNQKSQPNGQKINSDIEALLPNTQEFSIIQSQVPLSTSIRVENEKAILESRHSEDMELCTPQSTQRAQKFSKIEKQLIIIGEASDTSFNGIDEPAILGIEINSTKDTSTTLETIKGSVKANSKPIKGAELLDHFDYVEVPSDSQCDTFNNQRTIENTSVQTEAFDLPNTKSDISQIKELITNKLNIKKPRKNSLQEPKLKKLKTEKVPNIFTKLSEEVSVIRTPISKSKNTSSKDKTILTPDSDTSEWVCSKCTLLNTSKRRKCRICNSLRFTITKNLRASTPEADSSYVKNISPIKETLKSKSTKPSKDLKQKINGVENTKYSNVKYTIKAKPWEKVYLATTGLSEEFKDRLKQDIIYLKAIGVNISLITSKPYDQKTTHLIGQYKELEQGCIRSNTYLFGLLMSQNILSYNWIIQSIEAGGLLEEDPFVILGDSAIYPCDGPKLAFERPIGEIFQLFSNVEFYFDGKFDTGAANKTELRNLAKMGKGIVNPKPPTRVHGVNDHMKLIIIRDRIETPNTSIQNDDGIFVHDKKWFLDCISTGRLDLV